MWMFVFLVSLPAGVVFLHADKFLPLGHFLSLSLSVCNTNESLVRVEALAEPDSASLTADCARMLRELMELLQLSKLMFLVGPVCTVMHIALL